MEGESSNYMATRALCIHGHFYQPPREDPAIGMIPPEYGAYPYQNFNERIHAECYRPNAQLENFARISFNVGPTLLEWMQDYDRDIYARILEQDRRTVQRYGGGNAMAQAYNHTIMPLASRADKETQVTWGIADFEHRFGRKPQGMWLPETAADLETLTVLAEAGIEFTILAPWQADRAHVDPTEPYRVHLPGGRSIVVFFYHQDLSGRVSFDPAMTTNADAFVLHDLSRHYQREKDQSGQPQLLLVATDGELYGHHQPFRDKFLAYLLNGASEQVGITPTFPARWLAEHPVRQTVGIREGASWSCHHGVTRWMGDCSCTPHAGVWKAGLRRALDELALAVDRQYLDAVRSSIVEPWELRNRYIHVILGEISVEDLVGEMAGRRLPAGQIARIHALLEAQRERQRMFTSCGWFFDDLDRIEPKNNLAYAAQAVVLTRRATGVDLAPETMRGLGTVRSWRSGLRADQVFAEHLHREPSNQFIAV